MISEVKIGDHWSPILFISIETGCPALLTENTPSFVFNCFNGIPLVLMKKTLLEKTNVFF